MRKKKKKKITGKNSEKQSILSKSISNVAFLSFLLCIFGISFNNSNLKLLLNNVCALSSASFKRFNEPVAPPIVVLAHTTPTVTSFTAPGNNENEPAVCRKRRDRPRREGRRQQLADPLRPRQPSKRELL